MVGDCFVSSERVAYVSGCTVTASFTHVPHFSFSLIALSLFSSYNSCWFSPFFLFSRFLLPFSFNSFLYFCFSPPCCAQFFSLSPYFSVFLSFFLSFTFVLLLLFPFPFYCPLSPILLFHFSLSLVFSFLSSGSLHFFLLNSVCIFVSLFCH
jgi:hypothetical protein